MADMKTIIIYEGSKGITDNVDKASFLREKIDLYKKSKGLLS